MNFFTIYYQYPKLHILNLFSLHILVNSNLKSWKVCPLVIPILYMEKKKNKRSLFNTGWRKEYLGNMLKLCKFQLNHIVSTFEKINTRIDTSKNLLSNNLDMILIWVLTRLNNYILLSNCWVFISTQKKQSSWTVLEIQPKNPH